MAEQGFVDGENVEYDEQNANGDMATASSIAQKFEAEGMDLVFSITTPSSQAVVKAITDVPIVFAAVTDPVGTGLLENADAPEGNVTGVSDLYPVDKHLDLIKMLMPDAKRIGAIYNSGEANSVVLVEDMEVPAAEEMGYEVVLATAANSSEVYPAAQSLVGRVDVISVLQDNVVTSAVESVIKVGRENDIPVIVSDSPSVDRGAAAAYGMDPREIGARAGAMGAEILDGKPINEIPVGYAENLDLVINPASAEEMGLTISDEVKQKAARIVE